MYSPRSYHESVPRDPRENLEFRKFLILKGREDTRLRKGYISACKLDILFWINSFVFQYNPNTIGTSSPEMGPFITWEFQEDAVREILDCIQYRKDLVIEKSRDMGASWLCLIVMDWFFLFHSWKKFLMISRNAETVDKPGDSDSLFWKLDFIHSYLPDWMKVGVKRRKMGYKNTSNGSGITGQACTGKAGVGGKATCMFIDEFSQIPEDREVLQRTSDTSGCRIFNGTHLGLDTAFYEITQRADWKKLQMHWTQHPDKARGLYHYSQTLKRVESLDPTYHFPPDFDFVLDGAPSGGPFPGLRSPWYDAQCLKKLSPRAIAMDLDINPHGSVSSYCNGLIIKGLIEKDCCEPFWEGRLNYDYESGALIDPPLVKEDGGLIKLWLIPKGDGTPPFGSYAGGSDIAEGVGATPSCLTLINTGTGEKILEYIDRWIAPEAFAVLCVALCNLFKSADGETVKFAWEMAGPGDRFGRKLVSLGYRNIYYRVNEQKAIWSQKVSDQPGWYPNPDSRDRLMADYRSALYSRQFINHSVFSLKEFMKLRYDRQGHVEYGGSPLEDFAGAGVNHGDIVVADAIAWKMGKGLGFAAKKREAEDVKVGSLAWRRQRALQRKKERELT